MIKVVYDVGEYRRLLSRTVREGDTVVEIGPHAGRSTDSYVAKAKKTVLVDKGRDCASELEQYARDHGNAVFVCGDVRGFDTLSLVLEHVENCDVLAVDIGGGRFPDTVFKVWGTWSGVLKPRDSVIRCRGLAEFLVRARVEDKTFKEQFHDAGWLASYGRSTPSNMREQFDEFKHWVDMEKITPANLAAPDSASRGRSAGSNFNAP